MESLSDTIVTLAAIVLTLGLVPLGAYFDHRKRKMVFEERRLMIERGMQPPAALPDTGPLAMLHGAGGLAPRDTKTAVEACLRRGIVLAFLGAGLWVGDSVLNQRLATLAEYGSQGAQAFIASGALAAAGAVLGLTGIGNLVYYALARSRRDLS